MTAFGDRMDALRRKRKLSLRAMGRLVGMSHANLNKILNASHEEPKPPLGPELARWFAAVGAGPEQEPLLRLLAAAAHIPEAEARAGIEHLVLAHFAAAEPPRRAAEGEALPVPTTRS